MKTNEQNETTNTPTGAELDQPLTSGIICGMKDTKRTRRLNHYGCLINKGEGKPFLAKWMYQGKIYYRSTQTTDRAKALKRLEMFTQSLREDDVLDTIEMLKAQIERLQAKRTKKEIPIDELWETYADIRWGGLSDDAESTIATHKSGFVKMTAWMKKHGCRNASDITVRLAEEYLKTQKAEMGKVTYNNRLVFCKRVWHDLLKRNEFALEDVWTGFEKIKGVKNDSKRRALTKAETDALLSKADDSLRLLVTIGLNTAMRISDCAKLKWADIDMDARRLHATPVKTKRHGVKIDLKINDELFAELEKAKAIATGEYVCDRNAREYDSGTIEKRVKALFDACGIVTTEKDEDGKLRYVASFHSLRHTAAATMARNNIPLTTIMQIGGWKSHAMVEKYCAHVTTEDVDKAIDAISSAA